MDPRELEFRGFADEDDYNSLLEEVSILNQATGVLSTEDLDAIKTSAAKPAIIELLGELKTADDPRRERATDIPLVPEFIEDAPIPFTGGRSLEDFRRGALEATEKRVMRSGVELPPPAAKVFPTEEQLMEEAVVRPEDEPAPFAPDLDIQQKTLDDQAREMRRVIEEDVTPGGAKESVLIGPLYEGTRSLVETTGVPVLAPMARGMGKQILTESPAEEKAMQDYLHSSYYDQARTEYIQYLDGLDPDEKRIEWQPFLLKYAGDVPLKDWLNNALTEMEEGRTVESDTSQIMRGLMAPISAAYGVIEGTAALAGMGDARPFAQAIEQRVVEGGGSATAFEEAARYMAETVGFSETAEEFFGNAAWYTGFGVDFIIPIDLGIVGDAGRLVKTAARMGQDVGGVSAKAALSAKDRARVWASQITIARGAAQILEGGTLGKVKTGIVNPLDPRVSAISKVYMSEDAVNAVEDLLRAQEVAGPTRVENITPEHLAEGRAVKYTEDITEPAVKMYDPDVRHFTRILDRTRDLGIPTKVADFNKLVEDGIANAIVFETGPVVEKLKAAKESLATGTLPELSREANLALARGILREQAQSTLAKSMEAAGRAAGGLDQLRVGSLFIERTTLERVVKQLDESPIGKLNKYYIDEISKKLAAGEEVTNSTLIETPQSLLGEVQAYVKNLDQFGQTPARRRLQDLGLTQIRQDVSGEQINIIREAALMEFATRLPGTETAVGKALTAQTLRTKGGVSARLEAASIEELFAPEAIRLGPLARGLREGTRAVSEAMFGPTRVYNPITREYIDTIKNRFGAIQESYNSRVMRNRAQGFTPSEAFGKTVADVYAGRIEDLFDDYISIMFGGHETISQTLQTTGRTIELSKISLPVHKIKSLIAELGEEPNSFLNKGKRAFAKLIADGKYDEAYQVLVSVHKTMQGRPLGDFIEMGADRFVGANGAGKFLQELSREVPIYSFKNHTQLLIANFIAREQANIVKQTAEEFRRLDPFLFPTQQFVARFITTDSKHRGAIFADEMRRTPRTMRFGSPTEEELKRLYEASMADAIDAATGVDVTDRMSPIIQDIADAMVQRSGSALDATEEIKHALSLAYGKAAHRSGYTVPTPGERYIKNLGSSVGRNLSEEEYKVIMESSRRMFEKARKPTGPGLVPAGPAEALMDIPIAFEGITSKVALIKATDIEGLSEVLENIKLISPMGTAPSKFNLSDDTLEFMEELIGHAEKIKVDPAPGVQRLAKIIGDTLSPAKNLEAGANIAKTGVLSGVTPIANINFLMANALTAPAIIDSTVGGRYAMSVFNIDVVDVMKQVYGMRLMGQKISDRVLFTHPVTREPITTSMIADLVVDNSITKSQARAEISSNILESMLRYSGQLADGTSVGFIKDQMRRNWNPAREMNLTTQLGNGTDVAFRVGVLVKALKEGKSKQEAIRLAREALFDYGGLSNFEKKYIAKVAWFYTFQRQAIKTVLKTMVNNPTRAKNAAKLAQNIGGYDDKQFYPDSRDYLNSRARLAIIDDKENQRRYSLYGPSIPYISAMDDIINYLSFIPLMAKAPDAPLEAAETIGLELASKASPLYRFAAAIMFGKEIKFGEARTFGTYLDPRMVWYLSRNAELWEAYTSVVNLEPVPQDEARYGSTTYAGVQWRIPYDDMASRRAHYAFMEAALGIGLKRTIMDYGGIAATEESMPGEVPGSRLALQEDWQEWLRSMGVITAVDEPLPDEIPLRTREQRIRSLRELK